MSAVDWIRLVIGSLFVLAGIVIFFTELYGVFHFKYVLNRMHAAAMGDTLGISACLIGLMIFSGLNFTTLKMFLVIVFLWFASPVSSHVLSRLEAATNDNLAAHCEIYEDVEVLDRELIAAKADKNSEEKEASAL
ncbi:MAG: monovalent cation/H(+) antiporter subunit G [Lachnospiraceae bacterium]|jgi:multicomponent Na+:H+ antiporter subunit G|nr:monovalent cation/H(+) antiporter subunit G [Lachnospiraceae bacterium]MCI9396454.1 monovalent cation/H(+) antiporter subunit G [Lachnospiraceae bacterium]